MIDQNRQNMANYMAQQLRNPGVGLPPLAMAPNPVSHGTQAPHSTIPWERQTPQQRQERQTWMVDEASKKLAAQQSRPNKPFSPQFPTPTPFDADDAQRQEVHGIAAELAKRLSVGG